jgi:mevalonate kinase
VFACATSARTSELRASVDALAVADAGLHRACMDGLVRIANEAEQAVDAGDGDGLIAALGRAARGLARLGAAAGVGIVPPGFDALEALAARDGGAFCVSGAGGGDVAVHVGRGAASAAFHREARARGLAPLALSLDPAGVRLAPDGPVSRPA